MPVTLEFLVFTAPTSYADTSRSFPSSFTIFGKDVVTKAEKGTSLSEISKNDFKGYEIIHNGNYNMPYTGTRKIRNSSNLLEPPATSYGVPYKKIYVPSKKYLNTFTDIKSSSNFTKARNNVVNYNPKVTKNNALGISNLVNVIVPAIFVTPSSNIGITDNNTSSSVIRKGRNIYPSPPVLSASYGVPNSPVLTQFSPTVIPANDIDGKLTYLPPEDTAVSTTSAPEVIINKNLYYFKPPPYPEVPEMPSIVKVAPPQINYKIIFIKTPSFPNPPVPVVPAQAQNEEKTLVYVLSKQPEKQPEIIIEPPKPTKQSQPEVYFVNYQAQIDKEENVYGIPQYGGGYHYGPPNPTTENASSLATTEQTMGSNSSEYSSTVSYDSSPASQYGPPLAN